MEKQGAPWLSLRISEPQNTSLKFCDGGARGIQAWLDSLPKANVGETARQLYQGLVEINHYRTSVDQRLRMLEQIRPEVYAVGKLLERYFLNQSVVLEERPRKVANLCQALHSHLAVGYKMVVVELITQSSKERDALLPIAMQRACHSLRMQLLRACQLYSPVPEGVWLELHQLYECACLFGLQQLSVPEPLLQAGATLSTADTYIGALLLGCARTNQMRQTAIAQLYGAVDVLGAWVNLQSADQPSSLFAFSLRADGPPRFRSMYQSAQLAGLTGLDTHALVHAIRNYLALPADSRQASKLSIGRDFPADILRHVEAAWGTLAERSFQRTPGQGTLTVCVGLTALHYYLFDERPFAQLLKTPKAKTASSFELIDDKDVWGNAFDVKTESNGLNAGQSIEFGSGDVEAAATTYPLHEVTIVNHSPGGYCLAWGAEVPAQFQTGELIGIRGSLTQKWSVAVVCWIRLVRGGGTQIGVELLTPNACPCAVQLLRKGEQDSQFMRGLLLPELAVISRPASMIVPRIPFQEGNKVKVAVEGEEYRALLTSRLSNTASFSQFEYRRLDVEQAASGTPVTAPASVFASGEEDFDSLWKSL